MKFRKRFQLGRRAFLRGAASTVVSLPLLECMLNDSGTAYADGTALPCRFFLFFSPTSLVTSRSGGAWPEAMTPQNTGFGYDLPSSLQPLSRRGVQTEVSAVSGLFVSPNGGAGGYDLDYHQHSQNAILTGVRTGFAGLSYHAPEGPTADQLVADAYADQTRFPSLVYQVDPNRDGYGASARARSGGGFRYVESQVSPAQAYRSLFTGFSPPGPSPTDDLERRLRVGSLSLAGDQLRALQPRLGRADRERLDAHFTEIRALETRLSETMTTPTGAGCEELAVPADPANLSGGIPDHQARSDLFVDLIRMAFVCDLTRSVTLSGTDDLTGPGMRHPLWDDRGGLHADVQHSSNQDRLDQANEFFIDQYAHMLAKLSSASEGSGNVLDRTAAVFVMEGGKGGRTADGGTDPNHSTDNMLMLLAGRAGGLEPGQHIVARDEHPARVLNTAMRAVGVDAQLGDIAGTLDQLFTR